MAQQRSVSPVGSASASPALDLRESAASEQKSAAPDVDLRERGLGANQIAGIASVCVLALAVYIGSSGPSSDDHVYSDVFWLLQVLLWGAMWTAQIIAVVALLLLLVLIFRQRSILYVPTPPGLLRSPKENPPMYRSPETWGIPYENVMIRAEDGVRIHAWFLYQAHLCGSEVPYTIVYFHGNAGNIGHRLENLYEMFDKLKVNILVVDYRGYGDSEDGGGPSEKGFLLDAWATYRWLLSRCAASDETECPGGPILSSERILFFGRSIGGAVCIRLAAQLLEQRLHGTRRSGAENLANSLDPAGSSRSSFSANSRTEEEKPFPLPAGLILENTFTSLREMACQMFPFLSVMGPLVRWPVLLDEWRASESLEYFASNHNEWCCCLVSGLKDEIVPPEQMQDLYEILKKCPCRVLEFFGFEDGGHNDTPHRGGEEYWLSLKTFMDQVARTEEVRRTAHETHQASPAAGDVGAT